MKLLSLIISLGLVISANWLTNFEKAKEQAKENHHLILLNFSGSDWCAPCIKMKRDIFETTQFQDYAESHLILLKADFPRQKRNQLSAGQKEHNEKLAEKFNPNGKFPLTILLDADGKVIHEWDGYSNMSVEAFVKELQSHTHGK